MLRIAFIDLVYLYVVNHNGKKKETVEKFHFDQRRRKLYHLQTFQGDPTFIQSVSFKYLQQLLQPMLCKALLYFRFINLFYCYVP